MRFIKWILLIVTLCTIFCSIKPIDDIYCYSVGYVIGIIGEYYWLEKVINNDSNK